MFTLAILIGIYSYLIFGLGLVGLLSKTYIFGLTLEFLLLCVLVLPVRKVTVKVSKTSAIFLGILGLQLIVNLVGALGPELGFDALWYHLAIPKIWLLQNKIFFLPDGRYYYSVMPKLAEMLYLSALSLGSEIWAKLIHFGFGILTLVVIYRLASKWLKAEYAFLACVIFYANLVVGWQSITAYVDLSRTFFEVLALYYLVNKQIYKSGLVLGLAISTKLLAIGSLPIFLVLIFLQYKSLKPLLLFTITALLVPLPWFIWAYLSTGNPIYPIFSGYDLSSVRHVSDFITIFVRSADPISPIYLMLFPLVLVYLKKLPATLTVYSVLALVIWWLTPRTGGGRYLLPYLPVFSVLATLAIFHIHDLLLRKVAISLAVAILLISIGYRGLANAKFIPVILGRESKQKFLNTNLNKNFGGNYFYLVDPLSSK